MPKLDRFRSQTRLTSAESPGFRWLLPIFVGVLFTNLVAPAPVWAADAPLTSIVDISKSLTNHQVSVQAVISSISEPRSERAPYTVMLTESNAAIPLVYWSDLQPQLGPKVKVGNLIRANVTVSVYRDRLQLRIRNADAVQVISVASPATNAVPGSQAATPPPAVPTASPVVPPTPPTKAVIGKIKADWVDRVVIISGTISGFDSTNKVRQLKVQDATGEISVVLEEKVLSGLAVADLQLGRALAVTGPVKLYEGNLAVVPEAASAVKLSPE